MANIRSAYAEAVATALTGEYDKQYQATYTLKSNTSDVLSSGDVAGVDVADILNTATCTIIVAADGSTATINGEDATISFSVTEVAGGTNP